MTNFQKRTLIKMASVKMGLIFFPEVALKMAINSSKTTKEANRQFLHILIHKEYVRIFDNWGVKDWSEAQISAQYFMVELRKRV